MTRVSHSVDPVARAYATIGLRPGASARELKEQYKRLVKTWHPDRWANDPISQAEASQRMRAINDAYATLHRLRVDEAPRRAEPKPPAAQPIDHRPIPHRTLTDEELDAIVAAIGGDSFVSRAVSFLAWFAPMAAALVPIMPQRSGRVRSYALPNTARDWTISAVLFSTGVAVLLYQKTAKRRKS
jgi:hypothetical protein